jgi:hypothetical protein
MAIVRAHPTDVTDGSGAPPAAPPPRARRRWIIAAAALAVIVAAALVGYRLYARGRVSTDDAFIEARIIHISPKVGGQVIELNVTDNQRVREGDVLLIEDPPYARRRAPRRIDWAGLGLLALWLGALQIMLDKGQQEDWFDSWRIVTLAALTVAGFVAFVVREGTTRGHARSTFTAQTLYSGIFEDGSNAEFVRKLAADSPSFTNGTKIAPGFTASVTRA